MKLTFPDFLHCWIDLVGQGNPTFADRFDLAGFELALTDVAGEHASADLSPKRLEALADALLHISESLLHDLRRELEGDTRVATAGTVLCRLFLRERGSSLADPALRKARRDACATLVDLLDQHFERILKRRKHALRMRRVRQGKTGPGPPRRRTGRRNVARPSDR
jgi:hypothetical protein